MRVRVTPYMYTYPDIVVMCGDPQFADDHSDTLLNSTLIIEILSPSTDCVQKFTYYRPLPSLQEYILIEQDEPRIQRYRRQQADEQWLFAESTGLDSSITLASINCTLPLADVYERIDFEESPPEQEN